MCIISNSVVAVIVLYHPATQVLETIRNLLVQVNRVIVVINAASDQILQKIGSMNRVTIIANSSNIGLATALNKGLEFSFGELKSEFTVLFDQDSKPPQEFIEQLVNEFIVSSAHNLACIGPSLKDIKGGSMGYIKNNTQLDIKKPRSIPTSGTLISKKAFMQVGSMMDSLFIDGIDHEWCFRAYSLGFVVKVSDSVEMEHNIGDIGFNLFGEFKPIHRSPIRHYFIIRNSIYLASVPYIPMRWRLVELIKVFPRVFVYSLVSTHRFETIKLIARALCDGIFKKLGPLTTLSK